MKRTVEVSEVHVALQSLKRRWEQVKELELAHEAAQAKGRLAIRYWNWGSMGATAVTVVLAGVTVISSSDSSGLLLKTCTAVAAAIAAIGKVGDEFLKRNSVRIRELEQWRTECYVQCETIEQTCSTLYGRLKSLINITRDEFDLINQTSVIASELIQNQRSGSIDYHPGDIAKARISIYQSTIIRRVDDLVVAMLDAPQPQLANTGPPTTSGRGSAEPKQIELKQRPAHPAIPHTRQDTDAAALDPGKNPIESKAIEPKRRKPRQRGAKP